MNFDWILIIFLKSIKDISDNWEKLVMSYRLDIIMDVLLIFLDVILIVRQENVLVKRCRVKYSEYYIVIRKKYRYTH